MTTFIFVHIPKTAGTTFHSSYLPFAYPEKERFVIRGTWPRNKEDKEKLIKMPDEEKRRIKIIAGHNTFGLAEHFPGAKYITLFRDPVQLVLSFFIHALNHDPEHEIAKYIKKNNVTLEQFVEQDLPAKFYEGMNFTVQNAHFRALGGDQHSSERMTPEDYDNILDQVDVLGLTEEFDQFLFCMYVRFGFPLIVFNNRLVQAERKEYQLSDREIECITRHNCIDMKLVEHARKRYNEEIKSVLKDHIVDLWNEYRILLNHFQKSTEGDINQAKVVKRLINLHPK